MLFFFFSASPAFTLQIFSTKSFIMNVWQTAGLDWSRSAPASFRTWRTAKFPYGEVFFFFFWGEAKRWEIEMWWNKNRPTDFALQWGEVWQEDTIYRSTGWLIPPFISSPLPSAPFHKCMESCKVLLYPAVFVLHSSATFSLFLWHSQNLNAPTPLSYSYPSPDPPAGLLIFKRIILHCFIEY